MLMGRRVRRRALGLHNDVDLFPSVSTDLLPSERKLIARLLVSRGDTDDTALAPVNIHLYAHDEIEHEGKGEAGSHERIVDLLRSGEYSGGAAPDLRNDGKGRQLACAAGAVILQNLGEFGEQGERQRAELCDCKHTSRCGEEGDARCY